MVPINRKKLFLLLGLILLGCLFFVWIAFSLKFEKKVNANILVVEGWIPEQNLLKAFTEFNKGQYEYLLVTGGILDEDYILFYNSFLVFYPGAPIDTLYTLQLHIESTLGKKDSAHFCIWVNNERIFQSFTTQQRGVFQLHLQVDKIDSLMIEFDNDKVSEIGDRNLWVRKVKLNETNLLDGEVPVYLDRGRPFGRYRRYMSATSYAYRTAFYFHSMGVDPEMVFAIPNNAPHLRRTYGNALALRDWLLDDKLVVAEGIDIFTLDYHSRRSWLTYKKVLPDNLEVGVIASPNPMLNHPGRIQGFVRLLKETLAFIYYSLFVLPWI